MLQSAEGNEYPRETDYIPDLINTFVITSARYLNDFAIQCDRKLYGNFCRLEKLAVEAEILERKIQNTRNKASSGTAEQREELSPAPTPDVFIAPPTLPDTHGRRTADLPAPRPPLPPVHRATEVWYQTLSASPQLLLPNMLQATESFVSPPPLPTDGDHSMGTHPRLKYYFDLITLHVPLHIIQEKMAGDGVNPEWIFTPEAPAPPQLSCSLDEFFM
ncbi:coiled-coil domain-containing protein [Angomonas deanei]|uniref:Subunit CCDC53 of WASH complex, putative n=1 Tax=Angomonas deanei TaxID=59799 RepID=A0A7G2CES7_9TRYP|nr:coiled-coil domain-containing protein [Angomonas deanei]CAD2217481.1 Subunit CCDC53 of WASH complex, putative [Angomonas deanei]|eukprot:EPY29204.1 coiled-coil domain-containing protein [Angomonas deanei]